MGALIRKGALNQSITILDIFTIQSLEPRIWYTCVLKSTTFEYSSGNMSLVCLRIALAHLNKGYVLILRLELFSGVRRGVRPGSRYLPTFLLRHTS